MRVAQAFSQTVAASFGPEKLDRALRYIAATPEGETPDNIPTLMIRVPSDDGSAVADQPFAQVTVAELRRAAQSERAAASRPAGKKKAAPKWLAEDAAAAITQGRKALDKAVGRRSAPSADLIVHRGTDDKALIDVQGVPLERAAAVFEALGKALR